MSAANPINVTGIDHVVIRVNNLDTMTAWYRDVLGLKLERGPGELGLAQLRAGRSLLDLVDADGELGRQGGAAPDHSAPNMDHVCFQLEPFDTDAIQAQLRRHGVEFGDTAKRYGASGTGPSIYLSDPEGNTVELKGRSG